MFREVGDGEEKALLVGNKAGTAPAQVRLVKIVGTATDGAQPGLESGCVKVQEDPLSPAGMRCQTRRNLPALVTWGGSGSGART